MPDKLTVWKLKLEIEVPGKDLADALDNANNDLDDIMMSGGFCEHTAGWIELSDTGKEPSRDMLEKLNLEDQSYDDGDHEAHDEDPGGRLDG